MSFFERNSSALSAKNPAAARNLFSTYAPAENFEPVQTRSSSPTARYEGVYLHSRHDPRREAERLVASGLAGTTVFYGFGMGYQVEAFLALPQARHAIVVEPDPGLFLAVLSSRDFSALIGSERVTFLFAAAPESVTSVLEQLDADTAGIVRLRSVYEKNTAYFERLDSVVHAYLSRKEINRNTLARFGKLWVRNLVRNLPLIGETPGILALQGRFPGVPAVLVAAGPSLDRVLPYLREIRERCLIIAVDTSLRACLAVGVDPDFTVVVDPQYWNTRHLDWTGRSGSILVSESSTHPRIFHTTNMQPFFCSSLFPLGAYLEQRIGQKGKLGAGGSVSTTAWDFARVLGCSPIFCAGLDLGFPGLQTHYSGSFFEARAHTHATRLSPAENDSFHALHDAGPFPAPANGGGEVLTDKRLIVYKWWFENQMKLHPESATANLSNGIAIDGMTAKRLDELLKLPPVRAEISRTLDEIRAPHAGTPDAHGNTLRAALDDLIAELASLDLLAREGIRAADALMTAYRERKDLSPHIRKLDSVDTAILGISAREIAGFLMHSVKRDISEVLDGDPERIIRNSQELYRALHDSIEYHLSLLERGRNSGDHR